jgi:hypothetical protein
MDNSTLTFVRTVLAALSLAGAAWAAQGASAEAKGTLAAEFEKLHKEVRPPKGELWRTIPWKISLLEGREAAAKEKKPIFVWIASGEPLGCG